MSSSIGDHQILVFRVGPVVCSVAAHLVDSIVSPKPLHHFPGQANFVVGVLEYGKTAVSVVNLFHKFNLPEPGADCDSRYVMGITAKGVSGFWVDEIMEVTDEYEVHRAKPPKFTRVNIFDCTYLWRDKLVLNTDFDRLFGMNESSPIDDWVDADGANAIASTYPNSTIENSDMVAWSEPVDDRSEQQIKDWVSRGDEFSQPVSNIALTEPADVSSVAILEGKTADIVNSEFVDSNDFDDFDNITVSPLTEIVFSTVTDLGHSIAQETAPETEPEPEPEPEKQPDPTNEEGDPLAPFSVVDDSELEDEILASIAKSHGDVVVAAVAVAVVTSVTHLTDSKIEALDDSIAEPNDKVSDEVKRPPTAASSTVVFKEQQDRENVNQELIQSYINRDFALRMDKQSMPVDDINSITETLDLTEETDSRQLEFNLVAKLAAKLERLDDEVEIVKIEDDEKFSFKGKIKHKIVVYPSSANYVKTPNVVGDNQQKVMTISAAQTGGKSTYSPESMDEKKARYLPLDKVSSLILGDKKRDSHYKIVKRKLLTQDQAMSRVAQRISDVRTKKMPASRLRLAFAILVSAIIVFFVQDYVLNSNMEGMIDVPTLQLLPQSSGLPTETENVKSTIETRFLEKPSVALGGDED